MKVSIFKSLFNIKETPFELSIHEVYNRIRLGNPELIKKVSTIRSLEKADPEHDRIKSSLNAIMFNGTFTERNDSSLVEHSGLCILDFYQYPTKKKMMEERKRLIALSDSLLTQGLLYPSVVPFLKSQRQNQLIPSFQFFVLLLLIQHLLFLEQQKALQQRPPPTLRLKILS